MSKFRIRFMNDWGAGWLWAADETTWARFDVGTIDSRLPLSPATLERGQELSEWYSKYLNWSDPNGPSLWRQAEADRFNQAVKAYFSDLQAELGGDFELINATYEVKEDADLDEYLANPNGYWLERQKQSL